MTNEEKSKEISVNNRMTYVESVNDGNTYVVNSQGECYQSAMEMAKWKEQQMIEKAVEWLKDMVCYYSYWDYNGDTYEKEIAVDTDQMIEDFSKAMKGE